MAAQRTKSGRFPNPRRARGLAVASLALIGAAVIATSPALAGGGHRNNHHNSHQNNHHNHHTSERVVERVVEREVEREVERDRNRYQDRRGYRPVSPVNGACQCGPDYRTTSHAWAVSRPHAADAMGGYQNDGGYGGQMSGGYGYGYGGSGHDGHPSDPAHARVTVMRYPAQDGGFGGGYAAPAYLGGGRVPTTTATAPWEHYVDGGSVVGPRAPGVYHTDGATVIVKPPFVVPYGTLSRHGTGW